MQTKMLARITLPPEIKRGAVISARIVILHAMETGYRFDIQGRNIPKNVIHSLTASYLGEVIFRAEMGSGMSANPSLQFHFVADKSGELIVDWRDDTGQVGKQRAMVAVVG